VCWGVLMLSYVTAGVRGCVNVIVTAGVLGCVNVIVTVAVLGYVIIGSCLC